MEIRENKKCSSKEHLNNDAKSYCPICKIYMCNKCDNTHSTLFPNHSKYNLEQDIRTIFTGYCKNENHPNKLEYFCKNHNELCCAACLCKLNINGDGQHKDCDVCSIKDIKNQKKNKLAENIKKLEELSATFEESIKEIKSLSEKINKKKEDLQKNIQLIFTKIRTELNTRENKLLSETEEQINKLYFNDDIINISEKLPKRINYSLEKGKEINKDWNDNELSSLINNCINIEKTLDDINEIKWKIEKSNLNMETKILFKPEQEGINDIINTIKNFGEIYLDNYKKFAFKNCPINAKDEMKFSITGDKNNIFTKTGKQGGFIGTICINELDKSIEEHTWKIKILKTNNKFIMIGVAPIDFDINLVDNYKKCGWYFYCYDSTLYSGPPFNYSWKKSGLSKINNEITVIMNMKKKTLKFKINNEDKGDSYINIPTDKPIFPAVLLYSPNDSIEITE